MPPMLVLGFESSCDENGRRALRSGRGLLAHALHSQVAMHRDYGGVVPELASRDHVRRLVPCCARYWPIAGARSARLARSPIRKDRAGRRLAGRLGVCRGARTGSGRADHSITISRGTSCRRCFLRAPSFRSWHCSCRVATQLMRVTGVGEYELLGRRSTMPPARPLTRPPSCSAWAIRAGRRCRCWPNRASPMPSAAAPDAQFGRSDVQLPG